MWAKEYHPLKEVIDVTIMRVGKGTRTAVLPWDVVAAVCDDVASMCATTLGTWSVHNHFVCCYVTA